MDFQIQRAVDTSNVSDTPPPQSLKKRERKWGKYGKVKVYQTGNYV